MYVYALHYLMWWRLPGSAGCERARWPPTEAALHCENKACSRGKGQSQIQVRGSEYDVHTVVICVLARHVTACSRNVLQKFVFWPRPTLQRFSFEIHRQLCSGTAATQHSGNTHI